MTKFKALSLFSGVGLAETYLKRCNVHVCVANELLPERSRVFQHLYPDCRMITGDISELNVRSDIEESAKRLNCDFIIATPPCQGMSTAGKKQKDDPRNKLVIYVVGLINKLKPKFVLIENVTAQLQTPIYVEGNWVLISDYLKSKLESSYLFNDRQIVNAMHYGIPQSRERCVFLLARKDTNIQWEFPEPNPKIFTLRDAIGDLPSLEPHVTDITPDRMNKLFPDFERKRLEGLEISKWHYPPRHKLRHVLAMMHTAEGHSAWGNGIYYPRLIDGKKSKGYKNTYKRQWWDKPAYTVTRYTSRLGSQENGHPGRLIVDNGTEEGRIWSDSRVFSIFELMVVSSLPSDWDIPEWASSNLIRETIGEGVPPKLIEAAVSRLTDPVEFQKMQIHNDSK